MTQSLSQISLEDWDARYADLVKTRRVRPPFDGPLGRHWRDGDTRLTKFLYDPSPAALDLWNFLLTEEDRLREDKANGKTLIGAMKDLGTVPVMAYALPQTTTFYPDGAWWTPCLMEFGSGVLGVADQLGVDESFCPVRAMLGSFAANLHFPVPDLLVCSVGATCDDFSAIAQRVEGLGHPILWWEIPPRREPDPGEPAVTLPGGWRCPDSQVRFVRSELERIRDALQTLTGGSLADEPLRDGIREANRIRALLREIRRQVFTSKICPLPSLELLVAEMLALHFCSDRAAAHRVLTGLRDEIRSRVSAGAGFLGPDAVKVYWINPVAELRIMNVLEECGGRLCGTDFMFAHALDSIPDNLPPMEALAHMALADPMIGSAADRACRICREMADFGAEALVVSRIPGASHCALEGQIVADMVASTLELPAVEIEAPPVGDAFLPSIKTRLRALTETAKARRSR